MCQISAAALDKKFPMRYHVYITPLQIIVKNKSMTNFWGHFWKISDNILSFIGIIQILHDNIHYFHIFFILHNFCEKIIYQTSYYFSEIFQCTCLKTSEVEIALGPIAKMIVSSNGPYYIETTSHYNFYLFLLTAKGHSQMQSCLICGFEPEHPPWW